MTEVALAVLGFVILYVFLQANNPVTVGADTSDTSALPDLSSLFSIGSVSSDDLDVMARTIYGEARGEGYDGMLAVASVIKNRFDLGTYGSSISSVCLAPSQFSCWNATDPNASVLKSLSTGDATYQQALEIAESVLEGDTPDPTGGATNYFNPKIVMPSWAASMTQTATIGNHVFYKPGS